jgi:hypothetical protein
MGCKEETAPTKEDSRRGTWRGEPGTSKIVSGTSKDVHVRYPCQIRFCRLEKIQRAIETRVPMVRFKRKP